MFYSVTTYAMLVICSYFKFLLVYFVQKKSHTKFLYVLYIVVCPLVLFRLAIVLSVLLRFTDSDCPFGIFKLFL